jgi:hypothetical protein
MDSEYIQSVCFKLQRRLDRLKATSRESFPFALAQTWHFFQNNEVIKGILDDIECRVPEAKEWADRVFMEGCPIFPNTEVGNSALCYRIVKACVERALGEDPSLREENEQFTGVQGFRESYVEPLFDYIEEQIDDRRMILALLKKYKHRCEWFRREELNLVSKEGETTLVYDLYEYLHDQGLQFHIEPKSASGRIDLISAQSGKDRLVADAKIFNPEGSQKISHIVAGFRQVYEYTKDFNEPFGYLVIFKTCEGDLSIPTINEESGIRFMTHNNKTIFVVIIDIFIYSKSASERGKLKTYEILPSQFINSLSEPIAAND